eukprot:Mycagemm_TRINITY_DN10287_c1_g4::TRINITY_DN10287_c1_g4_i1::g.3698::m.3698 type:complete len:127 gc:universal TRINITY_DN10287_c1_g4_i1:514-134(-)
MPPRKSTVASSVLLRRTTAPKPQRSLGSAPLAMSSLASAMLVVVTAMASGERLRWFVSSALGRAPAASSIRATVGESFGRDETAHSTSGGMPSLPTWLTSAPASMSAFTTVGWPSNIAACSGVEPC